MSRFEIDEDWPEPELYLADLAIPDYVKNRIVLRAVGQSEEQATVALGVTFDDGSVESYPVLRVPLLDIGFESKDEADNAILTAMGHDPSGRSA